MKKKRNKQSRSLRNARQRDDQALSDQKRGREAGRIGAILLMGTFSIAQVPVFAAGGSLPIPCAGSNCVGGTGKALGFDPLGTHSTLSVGANSLTINQNGASAIFNWQSFNISAGNTVQFIQPSTSSVALNRIFDPNVTTIAGNLIANGQIYLINPNGILFGSGANINVGGLIAATSNITDARITSGLLSANTNVLSSTVSDPVFTNNAAVLGASAANSPTASAGAQPAIVVQPGATLYAAGKVDGTIVSAGRVFLFAPTVENGGTIKVDGGGQVILAAGSDVYLGSSQDPSLRGMLVEVDGSTAAGVTIDPTGNITVARGNITLMGLAVNQAGTLTATSALDANGSIELIARQANPTGETITLTQLGQTGLTPIAQTGNVNLASGSKTVVALDPTDTATAPLNDPTAASMQSTIEIQGSSINIGGNGAPGATLVQANGGQIWVIARQASSTLNVGTGQTYQINDGSVLGTNDPASIINVGSDAVIDASGLQNVSVNGANNFIYVSRLTSLNLANAPYQRTGFLLGQGVYLNLAEVPSWINVSNLQGTVPATQAQRNTAGGTVSLYAEGAVDLAKGSVVNVSGGSMNVTAAVGRTSELVTASGAVVNISNASADTQYVGFADGGGYTASDSLEGVSQTVTWQAPNLTAVGGYTQGANAGSVQIYAPAASLNGTLLAQTIPSSEQRTSVPQGGLLQIGSANPLTLDQEAGIQRGNILLAASQSQLQQGLDANLAATSSGPTIELDSAQLTQNGFSRFDLTSDGAIEVASGSAISLGPNGAFTARANAVEINSSLSAPGGSISLSERPITTLHDGSSDLGQQRDALSLIPETSVSRGSITFGAGTKLSVAGLWTNDALTPNAEASSPIMLNGGSIVLSARTVDVSNASFDVSAGAWLTNAKTYSGGTGGSLSITAKYLDPFVNNPLTSSAQDEGVLVLGTDFASRIAGFGVGSGGSLSLQAPNLQLGGATTASGTTWIDPAVGDRGFQSFNFAADYSFTMPSGTLFQPQFLSVPFNGVMQFAASGSSLIAVGSPMSPLPGIVEPTKIGMSASNPIIGDLSVAKGTVIDAGSTGSIALTAGNEVAVDGSLIAPAGTIAASLPASVSSSSGLAAQQVSNRSVQLGPDSSVDVSGLSLAVVGKNGLKTGSVLDAGTVSLNAPQGTVAIDSGAQIRAAGAVDTIDVPLQGSRYTPVTVASAGGTVQIAATTGVYVEGSVYAGGGNASAPGGNLSVALQAQGQAFITNLADLGLMATLQLPLQLTIGGSLPALSFGQGSFLPASTYGGFGAIAPSLVSNSGFDSVWLQSADILAFGQSQTLTARNAIFLSGQTLAATPGASVTVNAPYVALGPVAQLSTATNGLSYNTPAATAMMAASGGTGQLQVNAAQIDLVGGIALSGIGQATLDSSGAVRGIGVPNPLVTSPRQAGSLQFGGNLTIEATQIYPATQSDFTFVSTAAATDPLNGQLLVQAAPGSGTAATPFTAGGTLSISANRFTSSGTLQAPLGSIEIDAPQVTLEPGSVLSVSGNGLVPYGSVLNGNTWTYGLLSTQTNAPIAPYTIGSISGTSLPSKGITLNAGTLNAQAGSIINVAGGGDVFGIGFVAGPGGSYDMSQNFPYVGTSTAGQRNPFFALVPGVVGGVAPYDPQTYQNLVLDPALPSASNAIFRVGQTIQIGAGSALPAGTYTILPPAYALLSGAFAVEAVSGYANLSPGSSVTMPDGSVIVAGRLGYAAAGATQSLWSGYRVFSDTQFQSFSQFTYYYGSQFFASAAAAAAQSPQRLGPDAGSLTIDAGQIALNSTLEAAPASGGRGANIDIVAPSIIINDSSPAPGANSADATVLSSLQPAQPQSQLTLDAGTLSSIGAETLVLGAVEQRGAVTLELGHASAAQTGLGLTALAQDVSLQAAAPLSAGEIVLAAANVTVGTGAKISSLPTAAPPTVAVAVQGDGALIYAGNDALATFGRSGASPAGTATTGNLLLGAGAIVSASSAVFDATDTQTYDPTFTTQTGNLLLSAPLVNFGQIPANTPGLNLTQTLLSKLGGSAQLTIVGQGGFDVYGNATIGQLSASGQPQLANLTLDGPGLAGFGAAGSQVTIVAGHVTLENPAGASLSSAGTGSGQLSIDATASTLSGTGATGAMTTDGNVQIAGNIALSGFASVGIQAQGRASSATQTVAGTGDVLFAGAPGAGDALALSGSATALAINATRITAQTGVNATMTVPGSLTLTSSGPAATAQVDELGASLSIQAQNVTISGRIDLPAGVLQIATTGTAATDGITLSSGALLRVGGVTEAFAPGSATHAPVTGDVSAGSIGLLSANGSINEQQGATIDISGAGSQADAGALSLQAPTGAVQLQGALLASPGTSARGADISIDAASLSNASSLVQTIETGAPAADAVSLRARSGNISIAAGQTLSASSITLEADGGGGATDGSVLLGGTLDATGASGGQVAIYANNQAVLQSGALIDVHATAAGGSGGEVMISSRVTANPSAPTTLDAIVLQTGSSINASGGTGGAGGTITLRAGAAGGTSPSDVMIAALPSGSLVGAQRDIVEGVVVDSVVGSVTLDSTTLTAQASVLSSYMSASNIAAITQRLGEGSDPAFSLRPGLEVQASGDITVSQPIEFATGLSADGLSGSFTWRYGGSTLGTSAPGSLTLRAAGNLAIDASISDGFQPTASTTTTPNGIVWTQGDSWRYVFTAGADLSAADPNRATALAGNLTIGTGSATNPVTVRTGTGSIALNAGGSVILDNAAGQQANVVYTAGVANVTTAPAFSPLQTVVLANGRYQRLTINPELTQGGGDLTIDAGANVVGTDAPLGAYTAGSNQDGSSQTVNQWLLRGGQGSASVPTVWWPYFTEFQQGFGALGGGNLSIHAAGDVVRVDAVVAGQGYDTGNGAVQLNAGALTVTAAGKVEQGLFYDQNGAFQVHADAVIANSAAINPADAQTIFALGANDLTVQTRETSTFFTPFNPTASAPWAYLINSKTSIAYQDQFFTYGNTGGLDARVAGGALSLSVSSQSSILPPNAQLEAFGGAIAGPGNATELSMFPSGQGQLRVLANGDVTGLNLFMSQADASLLGQSSAPAPDTTNELINLQVPGVFATPLHASDAGVAAIVAQGGSISYDSFSLPKTTLVMATGSIGPQVSIDIQNSNANALSIISAGQQINFANPTFTTDHIFVGGPGAAQIVAGGAINLGTDGNGIDSRGNLDNASLPAIGASLIVTAGAGQSPSGFANDPAYQGVIDNFIQFDAFASTGSASTALNAKVIASLSNDPLLAQFVGALQAGLGARSATYNPVGDPNSAFSKALANLTPAQLAVGAVRLAAAIQVVNNGVFVQSQNSDTFAPAYAAFADLFPSVAINANGLRQFALTNLFYTQNAPASQVQSLQSQALVGVPAALVTVITQAHSQFLSLETSLANQGTALGQLMQSNNFGSLLIGLAQNPTTAGILSKVFQDSGVSSAQAGNYVNALVAVGAASGGSSSTTQSSIGASSSPAPLSGGPIVATESPQQALAQSAYSLFFSILSSSPTHSPAMDLLANSLLQNPTSALAQALGRRDPSIASAINELSTASSSSLSVAIAALDPSVLAAGMREIFANSLSVAGASLDALKASGQLLGSGSPYARELTALAQSSAPTAVAGLNDLSMDYNEIKTEETGMVSVFAPQGSVIVGSSNPPVLDPQAASKTADQLGIFSIGGGDIIGMVRDNFNVFQSRVFTVAGGDIDLWSSLSDIDAGRGPRDVAVAAPPRLVTDPATGLQYLDVGASVSGSGIGALETSPNQPPSNINLMAPAGYVDAGEAGIRAQTGTVVLGTNVVLNAGNITAASGVSGGAVVAVPPPPPPPSTATSAGDRVVEEAQREAMKEQQASAAAASQRRMTITGEFIGFDDQPAGESGEDEKEKKKEGKSGKEHGTRKDGGSAQ